MLGLDTNVLVRLLVRDDEAQFKRARRLIEDEGEFGEPLLVSLLVLLETEWVLRSRYSLPKAAIAAAFTGLLESVELRFEDESAVEEAFFVWKDSGADFADCLIGAHNRALGCRATASFDAKAAQLPGFTSL